MYYWIIPETILLVLSLAGFCYGAVKFFRKGAALFLQIVTCAVGCAMIGQIFIVVTMLTGTKLDNGFHVGLLGLAGTYFFLFSASFGTIDSLVDTAGKSMTKYKILSLILPALFIGISTFMWIKFPEIKLSAKIVYSLILLLFAETAYFNIKHIIVPEVEGGFLKSLRNYNRLVISLTVVSFIYLIFMDYLVANSICRIITGGLYAAIPYVAGKGVSKWYQ